MTDSESDQPIERRRADPLKVAADMLANEETEAPQTSSRSSARRDDSTSGSDDARGDDSPRARRAAAKAARQAAIEQRRTERSAARASSASKRHSTRGDKSAEEAPAKSLAEKLEEARGVVSPPPPAPVEAAQPEEDQPTVTAPAAESRASEWANSGAPTAADFSSDAPDDESRTDAEPRRDHPLEAALAAAEEASPAVGPRPVADRPTPPDSG